LGCSTPQLILFGPQARGVLDGSVEGDLSMRVLCHDLMESLDLAMPCRCQNRGPAVVLILRVALSLLKLDDLIRSQPTLSSRPAAHSAGGTTFLCRFLPAHFDNLLILYQHSILGSLLLRQFLLILPVAGVVPVLGSQLRIVQVGFAHLGSHTSICGVGRIGRVLASVADVRLVHTKSYDALVILELILRRIRVLVLQVPLKLLCSCRPRPPSGIFRGEWLGRARRKAGNCPVSPRCCLVAGAGWSWGRSLEGLHESPGTHLDAPYAGASGGSEIPWTSLLQC